MKPLSALTTFGLGGTPRVLVHASSSQDIRHALKTHRDLPWHILGSGSNLLINDTPLDALVIVNRIRGVHIRDTGNEYLVSAGGGVDWDDLVARMTKLRAQGIECLSGIPGTVGAAPVQNIGAYGQSVSDVLESVRAIEPNSDEDAVLHRQDCGLGYRKSVFQEKGSIVTEVTLRLKKGVAPQPTYHDLVERFFHTSPSVAQVRDAVLDIRQNKGALAIAGRPSFRSAGSFFKNPVVTTDHFGTIRDNLASLGEHTWHWARQDGSVKIAAGRLVEAAGFMRGFRDGSVGNSPRHALSLIAYHGATAADIVGLARRIQESIAKRFGIVLEAEPQLWGWESYPLLRPEPNGGLPQDA